MFFFFRKSFSFCQRESRADGSTTASVTQRTPPSVPFLKQCTVVDLTHGYSRSDRPSKLSVVESGVTCFEESSLSHDRLFHTTLQTKLCKEKNARHSAAVVLSCMYFISVLVLILSNSSSLRINRANYLLLGPV